MTHFKSKEIAFDVGRIKETKDVVLSIELKKKQKHYTEIPSKAILPFHLENRMNRINSH